MQGSNVTVLQPPIHASPSVDGKPISPEWRQFFANLQPFLQRINQAGFQIPNMTTAMRNTITPNAGQHIFNTDLNKEQFWNGTAWETITSA